MDRCYRVIQKACGIAILFFAGSSWAGDELRRDVRQVEEELDSIGNNVRSLKSFYLRKEALENLGRFDDRFEDAEKLFNQKDYKRAALVLFDLAENPEYRTQTMATKAIYYYAEALFQVHNFAASRKQFLRLVEVRANEYLQQAVRRLIQISDRMQRWEHLDDVVNQLKQQNALPGDVAYMHSKSLLQQGRLEDAIAVASTVTRDQQVYPKARYVIAICRLQLKEFEKARAEFEALSDVAKHYDNAAEIRDLATMNKGRILLEEGKVLDSIRAYQQVSRDSAAFDESLYEITWTYVRAADEITDEAKKNEEYTRALKSLENILLAQDNTPVSGEARVLLGNILLRLKRFDEADSTFGEVAIRYEPIKEEIQRLSDTLADSEKFYEEMSQRAASGGALLPKVVTEWIESPRGMKASLDVVADLDSSKEELREASNMADQLRSMFEAKDTTRLFPMLQDAQARMLGLRNNLVAIERHLLGVERQLVNTDLDPALADELKRILAERQVLEPNYNALPQDSQDYEARAKQMRKTLVGMQKQVYRFGWQVSEQQKSVAVLKDWLRDNPDTLQGDDLKAFTTRLTQMDALSQEMEVMQQVLDAEVGQERTRVSVTNAAEAEEDTLRARYQANLEQEREVLSKVAKIHAEYANAPTSKEDYEAQLNERKSNVAKLQEQANSLKWEVVGQRQELKGFRQWIDGNRDMIAAEKLQEVGDAMIEMGRQVDGLEKEQRGIETEIAKERKMIAKLQHENLQSDALRARYEVNLDIARLRTNIQTYGVELTQFETGMASLTAERAKVIREQVVRERQELDAAQLAIDNSKQEAKKAVSLVAQAALKEAQARIEDIVLRADVGIIDAAWQQKEAQTQEINRKVVEQNQESSAVEAEFAEVVGAE